MENIAVKDASCTAPLAFNGTACVCLTATVTCSSGTPVPCGPLGYGACPSVVLSEPEYELGNNGSVPLRTSVALQVGCWVGFGLSAMLFVLIAAATWSVRHTKEVILSAGWLVYAALTESVGLAGTACAALFVDFYLVWFLIVIWLIMLLLHVMRARYQIDNGPTTGAFWVVITYAVCQFAIGSGVLIGFVSLESSTAALLAVAVVLVIGILIVIAIADLRDDLVLVAITVISLLFIGFAFGSLAAGDLLGFGVQLILGLALFILAVCLCKYKIDHFVDKSPSAPVQASSKVEPPQSTMLYLPNATLPLRARRPTAKINQ